MRCGLLPILVASLMLGACAASDGMRELEVRFDDDAEGRATRSVSVKDLKVWAERPEGGPVGLAIAPWDGAQVLIREDGQRSLAFVGNGDEAAFRALVDRLESWWVGEFPDAAKAVGIVPGERAGYWSPAHFKARPGSIFAVRNLDRTWDAENNLTGTDIAAVVFVRSYEDRRAIVLLVARAPASGN